MPGQKEHASVRDVSFALWTGHIGDKLSEVGVSRAVKECRRALVLQRDFGV